MALTTLAGAVSGFRAESNMTVSTTVTPDSATGTSTTSTSASTTTTLNFRIDNRPAYMGISINLTNGDIVTAAGNQRGEFEVVAIHNHTTKTLYYLPKPMVIPHVIGMVISLVLLSIPIVGWVSLGLCIYYFVNASMRKKMINDALAMLKNVPAPTGK